MNMNMNMNEAETRQNKSRNCFLLLTLENVSYYSDIGPLGLRI